jgi:hypothetical protein
MNVDRRTLMVGSTLGLTVAASGASAAPRANVPAPLVHHVFFWLKNPGSEQDRARLIEGLRTLAGIETVKGIHIGVPAQTERRDVVDASFSVSEILFFDDLAGQRAYQEHPIHQKFVADCSHLWERVVVYDVAEVDIGAAR